MIFARLIRMNNPYLQLLKLSWTYADQHRRKFLCVYAMFLMANVTVALHPLFYGWFINTLQLNGLSALQTGWYYVAGFLLLRLIEWCFHGPARIIERQLAFNISKNYLASLYRRVLGHPMYWHQENHTGATISRLRKAYEALRDFFQHGFVYLYSFGKFIFSFSAMIYFSPLFGMIGVVLGILTVWIIVVFDRTYIRTLREVNEKEHVVSSTLFDSLSNIFTVITLRLEHRVHSGLMAKLSNVFPPFKKNVSINEWKWFTAQMMVGVIYAVTTIGYIYQHHVPGEPFLIGGLVILLGYVNQFTSVFNDIASQYSQIVKYHTEIENAAKLQCTVESTNAKTGSFPFDWKQIHVRNLSFSRHEVPRIENRKSGVHHISFTLSRSSRVALIGSSGSGKSTLLALLRGLHKPTSGSTVLIDGRLVPFEALGDQVTLFPQEPEIFENTVLYNLTLGLAFSEEAVRHACEVAQFDEVVHALPSGLDTIIREKGANLSGGQKQRLALARGILAAQESSLVLLDEPTSSVDPKTEGKIYSALFRALEGKAIVSSLHRLHLLPNFDYVYILRNGEIIDEGTFDQLLKYSIVFQDMWRQQEVVVEQHPNEEKINIAL